MVAALYAETGKKDEEIVAMVEKIAAADGTSREKLSVDLQAILYARHPAHRRDAAQ